MNNANMNQEKKETIYDYIQKKEVAKKISGISEKVMLDELGNIVDTELWYILIKFIMERTSIAQQFLTVHDPVKEPTKIARTQGLISGMYDVLESIHLANENKKKSK